MDVLITFYCHRLNRMLPCWDPLPVNRHLIINYILSILKCLKKMFFFLFITEIGTSVGERLHFVEVATVFTGKYTTHIY